MVAVTLKRMNSNQKIVARKKINDIIFEIELPDYKQQQSHHMHEHFRGLINTSNNSNMISQNPYSTPQATNLKNLVHLALMIVNHRHIQNKFNVLDIIFDKRTFLYAEQ